MCCFRNRERCKKNIKPLHLEAVTVHALFSSLIVFCLSWRCACPVCRCTFGITLHYSIVLPPLLPQLSLQHPVFLITYKKKAAAWYFMLWIDLVKTVLCNKDIQIIYSFFFFNCFEKQGHGEHFFPLVSDGLRRVIKQSIQCPGGHPLGLWHSFSVLCWLAAAWSALFLHFRIDQRKASCYLLF